MDIMFLNISDSQRKYHYKIELINRFEKKLLDYGYKINKHDDFELGAEWELFYKGEKQADFMWNVPYMLSLKIKDQPIFSEDYGKKDTFWEQLIVDAETLLLKI